jgi:hypothetical protein
MTKIKFIPKAFELKPCTKKEIQNLLGVGPYVITSWLKSIEAELGKPVGGLYSIRQVQIIIEKFGIPGELIFNMAA